MAEESGGLSRESGGIIPTDSVPRSPGDDKTAIFVNGLFRKALKVCRKQHDQFKEADKFVDGEQWDPEDEAKLKAEKRPTGVFNFVKRACSTKNSRSA